MIGVFVIALLTCAALLYVVGPLRRQTSDDEPVDVSALEQAQERKTTALNAIIELEEEAEVGKLTERELEVLRRAYEREALTALHQLDNLAAVTSQKDPLEEEIAAMRKQLACPSCGALRGSAGTCSRCNA